MTAVEKLEEASTSAGLKGHIGAQRARRSKWGSRALTRLPRMGRAGTSSGTSRPDAEGGCRATMLRAL